MSVTGRVRVRVQERVSIKGRVWYPLSRCWRTPGFSGTMRMVTNNFVDSFERSVFVVTVATVPSCV